MGVNGNHETSHTLAQTATGRIECPLCHGAGELTRAEVLERLGVKDISRIAQLSAEEAFRSLQSAYRQDNDALWSRYESELTRRLAESERQHSARVQELDAQLKFARERSGVEVQKIRTELEARIRTEQAGKQDLHRRLEEQLAEFSRVRARNAELEGELAKASRRGKLEEVDFEQEVRTWPGIVVSEKLAKNGDYILAFRDVSGAPLEPRVLVDNKNKSSIAESDIRKLVHDAKQRRLPVAVIVASDENQLRQADRDCRWAQNDGIWLLRTTRQWLRRDLDVLRPVLEHMRELGSDVLNRNALLADEIRRTFAGLDEVERELAKAAKAIGSAGTLTSKYRGRLQVLCENSTKGGR